MIMVSKSKSGSKKAVRALPKPPKRYREFTKRYPGLASAWEAINEAGTQGPLEFRVRQFDRTLERRGHRPIGLESHRTRYEQQVARRHPHTVRDTRNDRGRVAVNTIISHDSHLPLPAPQCLAFHSFEETVRVP